MCTAVHLKHIHIYEILIYEIYPKHPEKQKQRYICNKHPCNYHPDLKNQIIYVQSFLFTKDFLFINKHLRLQISI